MSRGVGKMNEHDQNVSHESPKELLINKHSKKKGDSNGILRASSLLLGEWLISELKQNMKSRIIDDLLHFHPPLGSNDKTFCN